MKAIKVLLLCLLIGVSTSCSKEEDICSTVSDGSIEYNEFLEFKRLNEKKNI